MKVVQGDTTMTSKTLVVFYDLGLSASPSAPAPAAPKIVDEIRADAVCDSPGRAAVRRSSRLEAKGSVVVTQKDQVVTGETAIFDTRANLITMGAGSC